MKSSHVSSSKTSGFTLLEMVVAFAVLTFIIMASMPTISEKYHRYREKEKLLRGITLAEAAANYLTLSPPLTRTGVSRTPVSARTLKDRGFLPSGYDADGAVIYAVHGLGDPHLPPPQFSNACPMGLERFCGSISRTCLNYPVVVVARVCWNEFSGRLTPPPGVVYRPDERCYYIYRTAHHNYYDDYDWKIRLVKCRKINR